MSKKLLQVEQLSIALKNPHQQLVRDINISLEEAGAAILLGQSGQFWGCLTATLFKWTVTSSLMEYRFYS